MPKIMSAVDGMMILILSDNVFDANCNFLSTSLEVLRCVHKPGFSWDIHTQYVVVNRIRRSFSLYVICVKNRVVPCQPFRNWQNGIRTGGAAFQKRTVGDSNWVHVEFQKLKIAVLAPVGLKYANKRKDAITQTLVKLELSRTSIHLRI